ncbi:MAG: biotin--[acetyl-CoA-carboxylase] ligase family protein [Treponema sp.]|jgi:BirA family biotin operon repressor/biotin-[acetyl-CoA-carboxylase] ligase|nr:biotin--[acetyl-CoA-carboxylase] ligase family protein [Treponema sp.]
MRRGKDGAPPELKLPGIRNPFGAPVYRRETLGSTMDEARILAARGAEHGTVIAADYQTAGRGRGGRSWLMKAGENLSFTVILRYPGSGIPPCLTLRAGLALSLAVEDFAPALRGKTAVKWPNDLMLMQSGGPGRKAAGILAEASGGTVYLGMGINVAQTAFPPGLEDKAVSIAGTLAGLWGNDPPPAGMDAAALGEKRFVLLEAILLRLREELEAPGDKTAGSPLSWQGRLEERLYMKGRQVRFIPGAPRDPEQGDVPGGSPASGEPVEGILLGTAAGGEILIAPASGGIVSFAAGELRVYGNVDPPLVASG